MSTPAWLARILDQPLTDRDRRAALTVVSLVLVVVALLLGAKTPGTATAGGSPAPRHHAEGRSPDYLQRAGSVARRFLRGYLAVIYGHAPAHVVADATPGVLAALSESRRVPPELSRLDPRIVAVSAAPAGDHSEVTVTATVSDGEVVTYKLRLAVARQRDRRLLVAKVSEG